jgi:hypothetical protein
MAGLPLIWHEKKPMIAVLKSGRTWKKPYMPVSVPANVTISSAAG